jgi:4-amino-4-deoxy-L-arabinose transferase-like glycosyltransferase
MKLGPRARAWAGALAIFLAALLLRLEALSELAEHYPLADRVVIDEQSYEARALEIVSGDWVGDEVFFQEPLYPYFIAAVYGLLGPERSSLRVVQALIGAALAAGVFGLARRTFGPTAGWVAGLSIALHRALLFLPGLLLKPNLFLPVWLGMLALVVVGFGTGSRMGRAFALGVLTGLGALLRGNVLLLAPLVVAWPAVSVWRRAGARPALALAGLCAAGVLSVLGPVAVRNQVVGGVFALTTSGAGTNVYGGNNAQNPYGRATEFDWVRGIPEFEAEDWRREAERRLGRPLDPGEVSGYWLGETWRSIRADPSLHLRILWNKARLTLGAYEVPDNHSLDWAGRFVPILEPWFPGRPLWGTLGIAGLVLFVLRRGRGAVMSEIGTSEIRTSGGGAAVAAWLLYAATIVATVTAMRARLPLVLVEALFAGYAFSTLVADPRADRAEWARRVVALLIAACAVLWPVLDAGQRADDLDKREFNLAVYTLEEPDGLERAESIARELFERHPDSSRLANLLAEIEGRQGLALANSDPAAAAELVERAVARLSTVLAAPGLAPRERRRANALSGLFKLRAGDPRGAESHLRDALAFDPDDRELGLALAESLDRQERRAEAIEVLERLLEQGPDAEVRALLRALGG